MNRIEAEFSNLVKSYRKKHMGKGPERTQRPSANVGRSVEMEALLGAKFIQLFVDIDIEQDVGMSVFVFDEDLENSVERNG